MAEASDLPLSRLARRIWDFAGRLSEVGDLSRPVEPIHLLLAFDQAGRTVTSSSATILHTALRGLPSEAYERIHRQVIGLGSGETSKLWEASAPPAHPPETGPAARAILAETSRIAGLVSLDGEVRTRYLLAALLLAMSPDDPGRNLVEEAGLMWDGLLAEMGRYAAGVREDEDDRQAWEQILAGRVHPRYPDAGTGDEPASAPVSDEEHDQPVSVEVLNAFRRSRSVEDVLDRAQDLATGTRGPIQLSTSFLLYALVEHGQENPQASTAIWLIRYVTNAAGFRSEREAYLRRKGASAADSASQVNESHLQQPTNATAYLERTLARALEIARQTGDREIHTRHLLAALLEELPGRERSGAQERLLRSGIDLAAMRRAYFLYTRRILGGQHPTWEEVLVGHGEPVDRPADYISDAPRGLDLIGIQREVNSFARLIAAGNISPPLSIGLFGDWGSGKTFFMNQLRQRVDDLSKKAQDSGQRQSKYPYYKRIVQIEFNAWHYVEGNLWASLVEHIFANLRVSGQKSVSEELRSHLIRELGLEERNLQHANAQVNQAQAEVQQANQNLDRARQELKEKRKQLAEAFRQRDLQDFVFPDLEPDVKSLLQTLGMEELYRSLKDMGSALQKSRQVVERGNAALTPLIHAPDRRDRWRALILSLVVAPLLAVLLGLAPALLGAEGVAQVTSLAGGTAALIGFGANWLRIQSTWISERVKQVEGVQQRYDQRLAKALSKNTRHIKELEQELLALNTELQAALRRRDEAERGVAEAQTRLQEATVPNLLASFIQDRAESNDYRKHLGLVAVIRTDFEKLSGLMEEENWRLAAPTPADREARFTSRKYRTLEEEDEEKAKRINRIVLYIDDLDRCPPNKVVEVLQAVHLLLAFPLFVVVVGVDARWITSSLEARYQELLHRPQSAQPLNDLEPVHLDKQIFGKASPDDYLEKIFQIPFWLRSLDTTAALTMLDGLLGAQPDLNGAARSEQSGHAEVEQPARETGAPGEARVTSVESTAANESAGPDGSVGTPAVSQGLPVSEPGSEVQSQAQQPAAGPNLQTETVHEAEEVLKVTDPELAFMRELAPLLGRSPRALKRFVNVYRLIKARLTANELQAFLAEQAETASDYQVVLFLLAVDVGAPEIASAFFEKVLFGARQTIPAEPEGPDPIEAFPDPGTFHPDINWLVAQLDEIENIRYHPDWQRLRRWLDVDTPSPNGPISRRMVADVQTLAAWTPLVVRYSFRVYNGGA